MLSDSARELILTSLRYDLPGIVLGVLMISLGLGACIFHWRAGRSDDRAPLWLGVFSAIYGLRLLTENGTFSAVAGVSPNAANWATVVITYFVPVPGLLFLRSIFPQWSSILLRSAQIFGVLGVVEFAGDLITRRPGTLLQVNNVAVGLSLLAFLIPLWRTRASSADARATGIGAGVFVLSAIASNFAGMGLFQLPINIEQFGFAVFLLMLGRTTVVRALESSRRLNSLDQELRIARRIQMSILPRDVPKSPHVQIAVAYRPMKEVGGDFYDFLRDDTGVGVLIADVAGHGTPAALIASMIKVAFVSQRVHAAAPHLVLEGMNEALSGLAKGHFVTAAYLYLDFASKRLRYSAAGHPPALRWNGSSAGTLQQKGFALGLSKVARYRTEEQELHAGERFLLYTDGFIEAHNTAQEEFGIDRLREVVMKSEGGPQALIESVLNAVGQWASHETGRSPEDDLTAVAIYLEPPQ